MPQDSMILLRHSLRKQRRRIGNLHGGVKTTLPIYGDNNTRLICILKRALYRIHEAPKAYFLLHIRAFLEIHGNDLCFRHQKNTI